MPSPQPGILGPVPDHCRYLEFGALPEADVASVLRRLASRDIDPDMVIGFGPGLAQALAHPVAGLRPFPALSGPGCASPSTQADLWCWARGADRGRILHAARAFAASVGDAFRCERIVDGFRYDRGLDLTGYEDGTENPQDDDAVAAAIVQGGGNGLDGSSYVAVQQWVHDLDRFAAKPQAERDDIIGRRLSDNEELDEAPVSAHVKRTAQESFDPEAFVVRRSMPWADARGEGLMFVAFGKSLDAFEAQLRRMMGEEDGVTDALFRFTRPVSGSYFWCPPVTGGKLDLSALGMKST
jgi:putative iron-dependent peroxidase